MNRLFGAFVLGLILTAPGYAQDSGPGPVDPATQQDYDVTLFQPRSTATGVFTFHAAADATSSHTTGDFDATIDAETFTGTYHAYDLGAYSFWAANGNGETNNLTAYGLATPDIVVGSASLSASDGGWFWHFFSRQRYWFYGTAAAANEPTAPTEPTTPTGT